MQIVLLAASEHVNIFPPKTLHTTGLHKRNLNYALQFGLLFGSFKTSSSLTENARLKNLNCLNNLLDVP